MDHKRFSLSFPKPEKGIHECSWIIEAQNEAEAVQKLADYLVELKRTFTHQPMLVEASRDLEKATHEMMRRLAQVTEPVAFIVTLHVFVEYFLDQILLKFCPKRDLTRYDFFKKLEIVYCMEKIPKSLFLNLCKLNDLRKAVAHDLDYDLTKMDLNYLDCPPDLQLSQYKPSYAANAAHNHIFNVLGILMTVTYGLLHDHCMAELGFKQKFVLCPVPPVAMA